MSVYVRGENNTMKKTNARKHLDTLQGEKLI